MDLPRVYKLYDDLAGARLAFLYSGEFRDEHSPRLIQLAEATTKVFPGSDPSSSKKLAFILVEAYQNIIRHRAPLPGDMEFGAARSLFMLRSDGSCYEVATMNAVRQEELEALRMLLDRIKRNSDLKQLKEMFLKGLQMESNSQRGGAGLGLIEMARRSSNGLHHEIRQLDEGPTMFAIQMRVGTSPMAVSSFDRIHDLQSHMAELDALFAFKGGLQSVMQASLMSMIAADLENGPDGSEQRVRVLLAALEMIGETREQIADPMIVLGRSAGDHSLVIGMLMDRAAADRTGHQIRTLAEMEAAAIQRLYRDALLGRNTNAMFTSTGLIDLARRSKTPLQMELSPHGDGALILVEAVI